MKGLTEMECTKVTCRRIQSLNPHPTSEILPTAQYPAKTPLTEARPIAGLLKICKIQNNVVGTFGARNERVIVRNAGYGIDAGSTFLDIGSARVNQNGDPQVDRDTVDLCFHVSME